MSRKTPLLGRLATALVTPFTQDGDVDVQTFSKLCDRQFSAGVGSVVVCGSTGESATVSFDDKVTLFKEAVQTATGRGRVLANVGSYDTAASIKLGKAAREAGSDAIMCVVPYYNKPPQAGLYQHFSAIARAVDLPMVLYNIPGRCVINMEPETIISLANDHDNILGLKEANNKLEADKKILDETSDDFEIYAGNDDMTLDLMEIGGSGLISTISNLVPDRMLDIIETFARGDVDEAREKERNLMPLMQGIFETTNPILVKAGYKLLGIDAGGLRLPLIDATPEQIDALAQVMKETGVLD